MKPPTHIDYAAVIRAHDIGDVCEAILNKQTRRAALPNKRAASNSDG